MSLPIKRVLQAKYLNWVGPLKDDLVDLLEFYSGIVEINDQGGAPIMTISYAFFVPVNMSRSIRDYKRSEDLEFSLSSGLSTISVGGETSLVGIDLVKIDTGRQRFPGGALEREVLVMTASVPTLRSNLVRLNYNLVVKSRCPKDDKSEEGVPFLSKFTVDSESSPRE
ncbi:hypothetical protein G3545_06695 [Starkeya sp. ORNL1]|uniref:hypothetical protein n=1 Tax=Starkeya sp. ORNL1 TaxID=2709380 RepID=UPI0014644A88|nr:hypothetical protein [Starkeya sp. ORNL1]QJP13370.1 hypothetical protein G3545_06695 [Starkeya sp. ORNL1]